MTEFFDDTKNTTSSVAKSFFDEIENTHSPLAKSFFDEMQGVKPVPVPARTVGSTLKDAAIAVGAGALKIPGALTGLADIPFALTTGTRPFSTGADFVSKETGIQPDKWANNLESNYSPQQKQAAADINKVWQDPNTNAVDVAKEYITHPGYIANTVFESLPSMGAGGVVSKAIMGAGKLATLAEPAIEGVIAKQAASEGAGFLERKLTERAVAKLGSSATPEAIAIAEQNAYRTAAALAGGAGEGIVQTGQAMDQSKGEDQRKNAIAALGSGFVDAVIGAGAGKIAQHLGLETAETAMAKSFNDRVKLDVADAVSKYGKAGKIAGGAISEGILQELPQSAQEQVFQNYADDKPLWEGVNRSAVEGMLSGFVMGAGANVISPGNGPKKTATEIELDRRAGNILNQDKNQIDNSIQKLTDNLNEGNTLLSDSEKLDTRAKELNISSSDLIKQTVYENKNTQALLDLVNSRNQNNEEINKKVQDNLSPEEKVIRDTQTNLMNQRIESAQKIDSELNTINDRLIGLRSNYNQITDPQKKEEFGQRILDLVASQKQLKGEQEKVTTFKELLSDPMTHQEKQGLYESLWPGNLGKNAEEYAKVFQDNAAQQESMLNQILQEKDVQKKQLMQNDYNKLFQTFEKDAGESADVFLNQHFTPKQQSVIENYWQGVKQELSKTQEEMTPGTEAFLRKKFFETKLNEIENNVKQDTSEQNSAKQNVTVPLAEQYKRQQWFQQIAKDLGDVQEINKQTIKQENPRTIPGEQQLNSVKLGGEAGVQATDKTSVFKNEPQVHEAPQFQTTENQVFVKNNSGEDLVGYHGTSAKPFTSFDNSKLQQYEHGWSGAGHYFTLQKDYAKGYADVNNNETGQPGRITEARFSFKNPLYKNSEEYKTLVKNAIGKMSITNKEDGLKVTEAFKAAGYDAVIDGKSLNNAFEINVFDSANIHHADGQTQFSLETKDKGQGTKSETTLQNVLSQVKQDTGLTGQLANFLSAFIHESKLDIKVIIDPTVQSAKYIGGKVNTVTLRDPSQLTTSLHEITHAVTVREMKANKEVREQVRLLMARVKNKTIKEAIITPTQMALLETESTSRGYKENILGNLKYDSIAYGLLNENEFLAQAMGNEKFQELLKATTIADKGKLRNAWDSFVAVIMKALGIKQTNQNAFGEALNIIAKLSSQENVDVNNNNQSEEHQSLETTAQKISDETYTQMFTERNNLVRTIGQTLRMRGSEFKQLIDKGLGTISTRLKNIDPMLRAEIRNIDFRTSQKIVAALRIAHPLLEKTKEMSPEDKFTWDAARRNSDEVKIKQIAEKYGMVEDQEKLRTVLDQIRQDAIDVGYDVGFVKEYWPRIIKDQEGFLEATKGISQRPVITDAIKKYADKLGMSVEAFEVTYPEQAADIASNTILGRNLGLGGPGNIQARQYETVPPELNKFYMNSDAALMQYIYSMTKKIETRRFFGKVPERIANLKVEKKRKDVMLKGYDEQLKITQNNPKEVVKINARIEDISSDLIRIDQELDKYKLQRDYTENIGTYINELRLSGRIQAEDEKVVRDILNARFNEHGTTGIVNAYKNMAYIDAMGSPISALTQIGDLAQAMYVGKVWTPKGLVNTIKNIANAITKKNEITKEDLGIERIAQEFADGTTLGNAVSWVFKKVGLEKIDSIGKEVLINNAFDNYKAMASTDAGRQTLLKELKPIFGMQSESVINDLLSNNPSDNVKMLLYHRLLDFQPVALSEMPEQYLKSGNGRIFYMLKTYTLKQFDVFRNEVWHKIKSGEKDQVIEGIGNMIKLVSLLTLANAGADELKDWMMGKETKFSDHVIENFLTLGGASKYMRMQTTREGLGSGLIGQILPPFRFVNSASKDLNQLYGNYIAGDTMNFDHARIIESLPIVGKLLYWHYGRGVDYKKSINDQEFSNIGKDVNLFKKQLENSTDKRTFLSSNLDKFKQMKMHDNFQGALSRNQAVINKLKKLEQTTNVRERLGQLHQQREMILNKYFEVANTMTSQ